MKKMIEFYKYTTINKLLHALKHVHALNFRHIVIEYVQNQKGGLIMGKMKDEWIKLLNEEIKENKKKIIKRKPFHIGDTRIKKQKEV